MHRLDIDRLFELIPEELLDSLAVELGVDKDNHCRLPGKAVFLCLLNGLLNHGELSLRLLEDMYGHMFGQKADHSSFGKRLTTLPVEYFEKIFAHLYKEIAPTAATEVKALRIRFADATVVNLTSKLLKFGIGIGSGKRAKYGESYNQVKGVFELSGDRLPSILRICREQNDNSDCVAIGDAMIEHNEPGSLWVFDKGCFDRSRFLKLTDAGSFFITPHSTQNLNIFETVMCSTCTLESLEKPGKGEPTYILTGVERAQFGNTKDRDKWSRMPLVIVRGARYDLRSKSWKPLVLMTNLPISDDGTSAGPYSFVEIAEMYRQRWDIEVFFKFLKQNLGYRHLVSRSENGIKIMIMMTLIASLLLIWYRRQNPAIESWRSAKFWFAEQSRIWTSTYIESLALCTNTARAKAPPN